MSFWENNKDTFKSVGISTVKGIGHGTAALGKAGYRTYKNSGDKNKGVADTSTQDNTANLPPLPPPSTDLKSYPLPPKRNVPTVASGERQASSGSTYAQMPPQAYQGTSAAVQTATQQQSVQAPQPYQAQPYQGAQVAPQLGTQQQAGQTSPLPAPPPRPLPQPSLNYTVETAASVNTIAPNAPLGIPQGQMAYTTPNVALPPGIPDQTTTDSPAPVEPKKPLPDASSFAPPPIHKDRGSPSATSSSASTNMLTPSTSTSTSINGPPKQPKKTNLMQFNINEVGPPPPAPYRPDWNSGASNNRLSEVGAKPSGAGSAMNTPPPPPPPRSSNNSPSIRPTPPPPYSSVDSDNASSEQPPRLPSRNKSSSNSTPPPLPPVRSARSNSPLVSNSTDTTESKNEKIDLQIIHKKSAPPPKPVKKTSLTLGNNDSRTSTPEPDSTKPTGLNSDLSNLANEMSQRLAQRVKVGDYASQESNVSTPPIIKPKPKTFAFNNSRGDDSASQKPEVGNIPIIKPKPQSILIDKISASLGQPSINYKPAVDLPKRPPVIAKKKPELASKPSTLQSSNSHTNEVGKEARPPSKSVIESRRSESTPTPPPPPPPRNYRTQSRKIEPPVLDLEIPTGWFANFNEVPILPKAFEGLNYTTSCFTSNKTSPTGVTVLNTRYFSVMFPDLSVISYKIVWENNDYKVANSEIEKYAPSPLSALPSKETLLENHSKFSEYVASWCEHKMGQKVGNGECWTLAHDALLKGCGKHAFVSTYKHHGFPILRLRGNGDNQALIEGADIDEVRRGDILQFDRSVFIDKSKNSTQTAGDPDHTSVVLENRGDKLIVAEQNVNGAKYVSKGEIALKNLYSGTVVAYRVMPSSWKIDLAI